MGEKLCSLFLLEGAYASFLENENHLQRFLALPEMSNLLSVVIIVQRTRYGNTV